MDEQLLPAGFHDLAPHSGWALATESARFAWRQASTYAELETFFYSMLARKGEVLPFLDQFADGNVPAEVERLFLLTLALAEVASAIENFQQASVPSGHDVFRLVPVALYPAPRQSRA